MVIKKDLLPHISKMQSLWIMCIPWSLLSFQEESSQKNADLTALSVILTLSMVNHGTCIILGIILGVIS